MTALFAKSQAISPETVLIMPIEETTSVEEEISREETTETEIDTEEVPEREETDLPTGEEILETEETIVIEMIVETEETIEEITEEVKISSRIFFYLYCYAFPQKKYIFSSNYLDLFIKGDMERRGPGSKECYNCHNMGHIAKDCPEPNRGRPERDQGRFGSSRGGGRMDFRTRGPLVCYNCNKEGHIAKNC